MRTMSLRAAAVAAGSFAVVSLAACLPESPNQPIVGPDQVVPSEFAPAADASPERGRPVRITDLRANRINGRQRYVGVEGGLREDARVYIDRPYVYGQVPESVRGHSYIQTASGDQGSHGDAEFLSFRIDQEAVVIVAHQGQKLPRWIRQGFTEMQDRLVVTRGGSTVQLRLFARTFPAGEVILGSNRDGGGNPAMYTVIVSPIPPLEGPFRSVSAGFYHTCGLVPDGHAYCWGDNANRGQLGDGTFASKITPVAVAGGLRFRSISAGAYHTCGVTTDDRAYCWGKNTYGQLGSGSSANSNRPVAVVGGGSYVYVGAGGFSSCGLTTDGEVLCWGRNNQGQLGNNAATSFTTSTPVPVSGRLRFASLTVGFQHACAIHVEDRAYCWGKNSKGQVGDGTTMRRRVPKAVAGGLEFASISATGIGTGPSGDGQNHTCALTPEGRAYCWGDNWHNNLGLNHVRTIQSSPQPVEGVPFFAQIATGGDHSCGLTGAGEMWCWGDNLRGQLGNGPREDYNPAIRVAGGHAFRTVALGWDHTCGVTTAGQGYCWGWNNKGQLGDGTTTIQDRPVLVMSP
jgi:alpha-tubulin suppressor-like RCC1 family protein